MKQGTHRREVRLVGTARRNRRSLLVSTALQAAFVAVISLPASAQPAPGARPTGGSVVAGTAAITQGSSNTLITQATQRAAIEWNKFDVGSQQSVTFQQPNTSSITLNRVTGPDPSQIAGRVTANGQIVISNQSGVLFYKGAQVDTAGLVATSANITNENFMSGKMLFDQPGHANARVVNEGTLTVRQAGLVGLVAPSVANSGVINAKLGNVVLAGAPTATLDMYGDGMLSIDVTDKVRQVPVGRDGKPVTALVTNTGTIIAEGGTVRLTAAAADGIVQTLVDAGGKIAARGGRVEIAGTGGSVQVDGDVIVNGRGPAGTGGQIAVNATDTVTIKRGAKLSANGAAGGGTVAIGTTVARAVGGPSVASAAKAATAATAKNVWVQPGATIRADAGQRGRGGTVVLLSTNHTEHAGSITARGGKLGGDGGNVEISGNTIGLGTTAGVDVSTPHGTMGTVLLDPVDLVIGPQAGGAPVAVNSGDPSVAFDTTPGTGTITPASLQALTGNVHVEATNNLTVNASVTLSQPNQNFVLEAGNNVTVNAGLSTTGSLSLIAASANSPAPVAAGSVTINSQGVLSAGGDISLVGGTGTLSFGGYASAGATGTISLIGDHISFPGTIFGSPSLVAGAMVVAPATAGRPIELIESGSANPNALSLSSNVLPNILNVATLDLGRPSATPTAGAINLGNTGDLVDLRFIHRNGEEGYGPSTLGLYSGGAVTQGGSLAVGTLQGTAAFVALTAVPLTGGEGVSGNQITALGAFNTTVGSFALYDAIPLTVTGTVAVPSGAAFSGKVITLADNSIAIAPATTASSGGFLQATGGAVELTPLTPGTNIEVIASGTANPGTLSLSTAELSRYTAFDLFLGPVDGAPAAGNLRLGNTGDNISLGSASVLVFQSNGSVSQGGPLTVSTISGNASSVALTNAGNSVQVVGNILSPNGFNLTTTTNLQVVNSLNATSGGITLNAGGDMLLFNGGPNPTVLNGGTGATVGISLTAGGTITDAATSVLNTSILRASGTAVALTGTANTVSALVQSRATTGDFTFTDSTPLTVGGTLAVPSGHTITLTDDSIAINVGPQGFGTPAVSAPGGTVILAPQSVNRPEELIALGDTATPGSLSLTTADIAHVSAGTLQLGSATTGPIKLGNTGDTLNLSSSVGALVLQAGTLGDVTEGGTLTVGTLSGSTRSAALTGGNTIGTLGGFSVQNGFTLADQSGLSVTAPVTDQGATSQTTITATGNLAISSSVFSNARVRLAAGTGDLTQTAGTISAPAVSLTGADVVQSPGAAITTGSLSATATGEPGNVRLPGAANAITGTGVLAATGTIAVVDSTGLTLADSTSASTVSLDVTGPLALNAGFGATNATLIARGVGGVISEGAGGTLTVLGSLSGNAAQASFGNATVNHVTTLGSFTTSSGFALAATDPRYGGMTVDGPVTDLTSVTIRALGGVLVAGSINAPVVSLTADAGPQSGIVPGNITLIGPVSASNAVTLVAGGAILQGQTAGGITGSPTLTGSAGGTVSLLSALNAIGTLGVFSSAGGFALNNSQGLTQTGLLSDTGSISLTTTAGNLQLVGTLSAPSMALNAAGSIAQSGGAITTTTGTLTATSATGSVDLASAQNVIPTLAGGSSSLGFNITDSSPTLAITGPVTAGPASNITVTDDALSFGPQGALIAPGGVVTLQPFASTTFTAGGGGGITGSPPVTAQTLVIGSNTASTVTIAGAFNLSTVNALDLVSSNIVTESGAGAVNIGTLSVQGRTITLGGNNTVQTLADAYYKPNVGPIAPADTFALTNGGDLAITGLVSATAATFTDTTGTISQSGTLAVGTLSGSALSAQLTGTNAVNTLSNFETTNGFTLSDGSALTVAGTVSGSDVALSSVGTLAIPGLAASFGGVLSLNTTGALTETGGIYADTLTGSATSAVLSGSNSTANQVRALGRFTTTTGFTLVNARDLSVLGPVTDNSAVTISTQAPLLLAGSISAPVIALTSLNGDEQSGHILQTAGTVAGSTRITLTTDGAIDQSGGAFTGGTLTGSANGTVSLGSALNSLAALGPFTSVGGFTLVDGLGAGATLVQSGALSDNAGPITLNAGAGLLSLGGSITAPSVALTGGAGIAQTGGGIAATTLTASSASGAVTLGQTANAVATLNASGAVGAFSLTDASALTIAGTVIATGATPTITLADDAPSFGPQGALVAAGGTVALGPYTPNALFTVGGGGVIGGESNVTASTLTVGSGIAGTVLVTGPLDLTGVASLNIVSGGAVGETGAGSISVGTLNASGSAIALTGANTIGVLGNVATPGAFAFSDTGFSVAGAVSVGSATLTSSGGITETGSITTAALSVGAGGAVTLSGSNAVGSLVSVNTTGGFSLNDTVPLTVSGPASDTTAIALQTTGSLVVGGTLAAPSVNLVAGGPITEVTQGGTTGPGLIAADLLTGSGAGVTLGAANQVGSLGIFNSSGDFLLANAGSLTIQGSVLAAPGHTLTIASDATTFGAGGTLTAQNGVVALTPFTVNGTLAVGGGTSLGGSPAVNAGTLVLGSSSTGTLLVTGAVNVTGAATLDLVSGGDVTETGTGSIAAGVLVGRAGNGFNLGGANQIATLGAVSSGNGGSVTIYDTIPITLSGTVTAPGAQILFHDNTITVAPGALLDVTGTVAGSLANAVFFTPYTSTDSLTLLGGNGVAGVPITVASLVSIGSSAITSGGNILASNVTINGGFNFGTASVRLTAMNLISESPTGAIAGGTLISGGVGGLVNFGGSGTVSLTGGNAFASVGTYTSGGGFMLNNARSLAVTGPITDGTAIILTAAGSLAIGGTLQAPTVNLVTSGDVTQNAGTIGTGRLTGSVLGGVTLDQANSIDTLGSFSTNGAFALSDTAPLTIGGAVSEGLLGTSLRISDNAISFGGGNLTSNGAVVLQPLASAQNFTIGGGSGTGGSSLVSGTGLTLGAAGTPTTIAGALNFTGVPAVSVAGSSIAETNSGALAATTLSIVGPSSTVSLGGANVVGTLSSAGGLGSLLLNTVGSLGISGDVSATTATLTAGGQIVQTGGTFSVGTLSGRAVGLAQFGPDAAGPVAQVGTLGPFSVTNVGTLNLADSIPLTITGPVSAAQIAISAPSSIVLNGGTILTDGLGTTQESGPQGTQQGSYLQVTAATESGTGQFSQTGTTRVAGLDGTASTLRIQVPDGGTISLNNLVGTGTSLVLGTGTGGQATGTLAVGGLLVVGQGGSAVLSGSVAGQAGTTAAQGAFITPARDPNYLLNGCEIASVSCTLSPLTPIRPGEPDQPEIPGETEIPTLPSNVPSEFIAELAPKSFLPNIYLITLNLLTLAIAPDPNDPDLLLPNISAQDY